MFIQRTAVSCGIGQIYRIGNNPNEKEYNIIMRLAVFDYAMIIASLTTRQKRAIKFIKSKGFKQIDKARKNPNSGNDIILFKKDITKSAIKKHENS